MSGERRRFRSSLGRGTVLVGLLLLNIGASLAVVVATLAESGILGRYLRGEIRFEDDIVDAIDRSVLFSRIGLAVFVVTGIAWLVWHHRAQANLHALGVRGLQYTPGWAVGWWLIPFANLFKPFQTVREVWKASEPSPAWRSTRTWPVIGWWWAGWVVANVIGRIALTLFREDPDTVESLIEGNRWIVAGEIVTVVTAILAIGIVRAVIARQSELASAIAMQAEEAPPRPDRPGLGA